MPIHLLKSNSGTLSVSSSSGTFPAIWLSVCLQPIQQRRYAKERLPVNVNCQGSEASPSIAAAKELCGTEGGGERTHGGSEGVMAEMEKENCISLAARVSHDCQTASEALCEIWHLNIEISRYSYYRWSPNCRHGNWITGRWLTENWDVLAGWMRPRRSGTKPWK